MHRFCARRRWELLLLVGIPAVGWIAHRLSLILLSAYYGYSGPSGSEEFYSVGVLAPIGGASVLEVALLAVLYGRVRRLGQPFLSLLWGYLLALTGAELLVAIVGIPLLLATGEGISSSNEPLIQALVISVVIIALEVVLLLWFARQASRFSLSHAFFLFLLGGLGAVGLPAVFLSGELNLVRDVVELAVSLGVGVIGAWLLGNFEERGLRFRQGAIVGLIALWVYDAATTDWVRLGVLVVFFALVYAVRVRNPGPSSEEEPHPAET